ncbi:hypothetical protein [Paenibacillus sp. HW567]|uniref:hypothetical protein n=1 Tax=Paenibacillus sp. HW567 TaxID=1034769 RepID=UPI00035CE6E8|nr:hypothetical protein [Paenibacillus sp. HW567]
MQDNLPVSGIKTPLAVRSISTITLVIIIQIVTLVDNLRNQFHPHITLRYFMIFWVAVCTAILAFLLWNALRKTAEIKWGEGLLLIRNENIPAGMIQSIHIDGSLVGIKLSGKRIVPLRLCFRFIDDREQSMKQLGRWAMENGIKLDYGLFLKWM